LPVKRLTRERLRSKIREATEMRAGARRVAEGFARAGGAVAAANAFEELLGRRNAGSEPRRSPASEVGASP
ncbi:MAG TPA: hypothetical protein VG010_12370, partial [Solirubrobacteraceae bacterium]|nr:hypothetical protein [Solirubrobacteraceae bacterium]